MGSTPSNGALRRHFRRLRKHLSWMALAVAGQLGCRSVLPADQLRSATDLAGNFLQTFGGIYGIVVAFAIYVEWTQLNETQVTIEREAVALEELFRLLHWLSGWSGRERALERFIGYATDVAHNSPAGASRIIDSQRAALAETFEDFMSYLPEDPLESRLHDGAIGLFHELNEAREHRRTIAALRLPEGLRWFVFIGGAITVSALWLVFIEAEVLQAVFTAGMTWVVVAISSIVVDLDNPFQGDFVVSWQRFGEAAALMKAIMQRRA
jgi:hypothetical protein